MPVICSDGEFLRACVGDTLVFGAVGYHTQECRVGSGDAMNVVLRVLKVEVGTAEVNAADAEGNCPGHPSLGVPRGGFRVSE